MNVKRLEPRNKARRPKMIAKIRFKMDRQRTPPVSYPNIKLQLIEPINAPVSDEKCMERKKLKYQTAEEGSYPALRHNNYCQPPSSIHALLEQNKLQ